MTRLVLLLFVPALLAFDSSFNYGCQNGQCTFQLVVPKEVAQAIDEQTLNNEVATIASSLSKLDSTILKFNDTGACAFTKGFNANFTVVNATGQSLNDNVQVASNNASDLLTASANANTTATLLYNSISCFQQNVNSSYTCFSPPSTIAPSTIAPSTTASDVSTVNPVTDNGSTVSQGTQPTGGSTAAPVSTDAPGSTVSGATDASVASTAGGDTTASGASVVSTAASSEASTAAPEASSAAATVISGKPV
ncbi:Flo11 domain-containing protein [Caenorhabditis elegans]|uniref:Flo11 domain-containing protein n=1 Tax=Caenorhabditis elegans TaxID=6239 RepID=Q8I116_CAEEL|nr:Flo11 domain-containing protein [Caenorhabditis elegans]CAD59151.1 Flo11 domain-containing protein [Caenorhabditis elegans]|eukprot:NP_496297.2 Uncharacterized protein CELE_M28.10 [Caenorhabditis elegans]